MTFKIDERIRETSTTTGTGTYTLGGAPTGFQPFSSVGANNYCPYFATDGTDWEVGIGQYLSGPNRLTRDAVIASSNAGAAVSWAAGSRTLRCGWPAWLALPRTLLKNVAGGAGTTVLTQNEQRYSSIQFIGALTGNRVIEVDATPWTWMVFNNTSGAYTLSMKITGGVALSVPQGRIAVLYSDGTDVRDGAGIPGGRSSEFASGTAAVFAQTSAPTGWTKSTTHNDKALRVVSGAAGSGGVTAFTSVFGAGKVTGAHTLTTSEIPAHSHNQRANSGVGSSVGNQASGNSTLSGDFSDGYTATDGGSGGSHDHTLSLDLAYVDVIIATKD